MTVNMNAIVIFALVVFATCIVAYVGLFLWSRKLGRESAHETAVFERELDRLLRR